MGKYFDKMFDNYYRWHSNSFNLAVHAIALPLGLLSTMVTLCKIFGVIAYVCFTVVYVGIFASLMHPALATCSGIVVSLLSVVAVFAEQNLDLFQSLSLSVVYFGIQLCGHQCSGQGMFLQAYANLPNAVDHAVEQFVFRVPLFLRALYITLPKYVTWVLSTRTVVHQRRRLLRTNSRETELRAPNNTNMKGNTPLCFLRDNLAKVVEELKRHDNWLSSLNSCRIPLSTYMTESHWSRLRHENGTDTGGIEQQYVGDDTNARKQQTNSSEGDSVQEGLDFDELDQLEKVRQACDEVRYSPCIEQVLRLIYSKQDFAIRPVRCLDELIVLDSSSVSDSSEIQTLFDYHIDGAVSILPSVSIVSCFVLLNPTKGAFGTIESWESSFRPQHQNLTSFKDIVTAHQQPNESEVDCELDAGSFVVIDYHSGMYRMCPDASDAHGGRAVYLKFHYVLYPTKLPILARAHVALSSSVIATMSVIKNIRSILHPICGVVPLAIIAGSLCFGIAWSRMTIPTAVLGTCYHMLSLAAVYGRLLNPAIDFALLRRDWWVFAIGYQLALLAMCFEVLTIHDPPALLCVAVGLLYRASAILSLSGSRMSYGMEYGACERNFTSGFPFTGAFGVGHPMSLGNMLILFSLIVPVRNQSVVEILGVVALLSALELLNLYIEHNGVFFGAPPSTKQLERSRKNQNFVAK